MKIREFEREVCDALGLYGENVTKAVRAAINEAAKEGLEVLKTTGGYKDRSGKYRKSFRIKKDDTYRTTNRILYASGRQYALTHLLEHGHAAEGGTERVAGEFPHWKPAEQHAIKKCVEYVSEAIEGVTI